MPALSSLHRTAFVTGASGGLGRAFVEMLLAEGVKVWGTARDPQRLAGLAAKPGFTAVQLDLTSADAALAAFARAEEQAGGAFDVVINNAGYGVFAPFHREDFSVWQAQLEAMLTVTLRLAHAAFGTMQARGRGVLVNVSSLAADFPLPFMSAYNVAKAGLSAFSESLMLETAGTGLTVIDFRPGDHRTGFNQAMQPPSGLQASSARTARVWRVLEANLRDGPPPEAAARDLRRTLARPRSGVVRSGSFFQARLAPLLARLAPAALRRAAMARYFGST